MTFALAAALAAVMALTACSVGGEKPSPAGAFTASTEDFPNPSRGLVPRRRGAHPRRRGHRLRPARRRAGQDLAGTGPRLARPADLVPAATADPAVHATWGDHVATASTKLGYRLETTGTHLPTASRAGGTIEASVTLRNVGDAAPMEAHDVALVLSSGSRTVRTPATSDVRRWLPENVGTRVARNGWNVIGRLKVTT